MRVPTGQLPLTVILAALKCCPSLGTRITGAREGGGPDTTAKTLTDPDPLTSARTEEVTPTSKSPISSQTMARAGYEVWRCGKSTPLCWCGLSRIPLDLFTG